MAFGRDRGPRVHVPDVLAKGMRGQTTVAHHPTGHVRQAIQQAGCDGQLMRLTGRDGEADSAPARLGHYAGLRPEAAARATERLAVIPLCLRPPFRAAPAAF